MKKLIVALLSLFFISFAEAQSPAPSETYAIVSGRNVTPYPCGSTITTGNTAQPLISTTPVNSTIPSVRGFIIMNIDTTEPLWISFTGTALAGDVGSYPIAAATATTFAGAGSFSSPLGFGINKNPSVVAATSGHKFSCTYY